MKACESCRYWSARVASIAAGQQLQAACLAPAGSVFAGQFVTARQSCDAYQAGEAVDRREVAA